MTELSRRAVLRAAALSAAALPFASIPLAGAATTGSLYRRSRFHRHLGQPFGLTSGRRAWHATLVSIHDLPGAPSGSDHCFRLVFHTGSAGPAQKTCTLRRKGFTATPIFVVPTDTSRRTYEAVVNRLN